MNSSISYHNESQAQDICGSGHSTIWTIIFIFCIVTGLPVNALVMWIIGCQKNRLGLSALILNLAISDFLFLTISSFQVMYFLQNKWLLGTIMCKLNYFLYGVAYYSSLFLLTAVSVHRCLMVLFPLWYRCHKPQNFISIICISVWIVASLCSLPGLIFAEVKNESQLYCSDNNSPYEKLIRVLNIVVEGLLPFFIVVFTHTVTVIRMHHHRSQKMTTKLYRIIAVTVSAYIIFCLPFQVTQILYLVSILKEQTPANQCFFHVMFYSGLLINLNSCVNPFIYLFLSGRVKQVLCLQSTCAAKYNMQTSGKEMSSSGMAGSDMQESNGETCME
ncbi:probable G-protein coupled receptor 152 [Rhinatrema bivittatum]|uniref:probable G-protein coupled receptor 152 n=1 Tax=Rhinatrema bivittatum TaxID=194408 RepID=UPI001126D9C2|nr:probable G-protein coupled receptor 152 [Rhinatrema bivittatum]